MAIKTDLEISALIGAVDTTLLNPTTGRASIQKGELHNTTTDTVVIELFKSSDATSATAERIYHKELGPDESDWVSAAVMVLAQNFYLIGLADAGNGSKVSFNGSYKLLTGSD